MKPVRELFILEDHDCNYKIFSDINLAYDYVIEYIKENLAYAALVLIPLTFCKAASDADDYMERRNKDGT